MSLLLEPRLSLPLAFAEQLESQLRATAKETSSAALLRDADSLHALIRGQFPELAADEDEH
jgi:hypothetical protein